MSDHLALYRKYRPAKFPEVIGQEAVVTALERASKDGRIGHAYLFSGGRGTGKTTLARIFATAIGTTPSDLYEMDAASNRGIDDVRELREAVRTLPFESKYKVYIIDEAHMLTKDAWNALLKTLEEPPAHVVFIFATTEKDKIIDTILSRCQHFVLKQPTLDILKKHAIDVAKKEGIILDGASAELIATFGDGSFRDMLSVLEKVLHATKGGKTAYDDVAQVVGAPAAGLVNDVLRALAEGETGLGLAAVRKAMETGVDMKVYSGLILAKLRAVLILRYDSEAATALTDDFTPEDIALLKSFAAEKEKRINSHALVGFLEAAGQIGYSAIPSLPLELALVRIAELKSPK